MSIRSGKELSKMLEEVELLKDKCNSMSEKYLEKMINYLTKNASCNEVVISILLGQIQQMIGGIAVNVIPDLVDTTQNKIMECIMLMNFETLELIQKEFTRMDKEIRH